jgi:hypothetical protein
VLVLFLGHLLNYYPTYSGPKKDEYLNSAVMGLETLSILLALSAAAQALVPRAKESFVSVETSPTQNLTKRADDPSDFSWVNRWAAIGDSYTAGIGAGVAMGDMLTEELTITLPNGLISGHGDWYCARYDMSYPMIVDRLLGGQVDDFQFHACSGDRSQQIHQQAQQLNGKLDLVMMTAGGNDLCLVSHPPIAESNP